MNKEQMLLDALNRFGNFKIVTQEFSEEQLGVIYELMDMVEQRHKVSDVDTRAEPALPIQNVTNRALLLKIQKLEAENKLLEAENKLLDFMVENGLGEEDMINDITYPHEL